MGGYSAIVMDHFRHPRNVGRLDPCNASGSSGTPGNGPFTRFTVRLSDGLIAAIGFETFGCRPAIAASSVLTEMVLGRPLSETSGLTRETLLEALGGLPEDKVYCADLAIGAWRNLLASRSGPGEVAEGG